MSPQGERREDQSQRERCNLDDRVHGDDCEEHRHHDDREEPGHLLVEVLSVRRAVLLVIAARVHDRGSDEDGRDDQDYYEADVYHLNQSPTFEKSGLASRSDGDTEGRS